MSTQIEEELKDPQETYRQQCRATQKCAALNTTLKQCNDRVNSRSKTAETCMEEVIDFFHCVDHCAAGKFFKELK